MQDLNEYFEALMEKAALKIINQNAAEEDRMVTKHGEMVPYKKAAQLLNCTPQTVKRWGNLGYLEDNGHGIGVRSIARFLQKPKAERAPRKPRKHPPCNFVRVQP